LVYEWLEHERALVVCQNAEVPAPAEWSGYLEQLRRVAHIKHRAIVYTEIHLTRPQQVEVEEATRSQTPPRVAVISPSTAVRFVASMFTLLNRDIRFFAPTQYAAAITHLGLTTQESEAVRRCYDRLMAQVQADTGAVAKAAQHG
jgi:hypothetical protein